jgi:hypothetical protein
VLAAGGNVLGRALTELELYQFWLNLPRVEEARARRLAAALVAGLGRRGRAWEGG